MSNVIWVLQRRGRDPSWETVPGSPTFATKEAAEKAILEHWPVESAYIGTASAQIRAARVKAAHVTHEVSGCRECPYRQAEFDVCTRTPRRPDTPLFGRSVDTAKPPPDWCPLREADVTVKLKVIP